MLNLADLVRTIKQGRYVTSASSRVLCKACAAHCRYIVDYNKFRPGAVSPGLLWVLEQLPGYTEAADLYVTLHITLNYIVAETIRDLE